MPTTPGGPPESAGATGYGPHSALIVTDIQNDFADPRGSLSVAGGHELTAAVNREVARAREAGALVVYTQDWHPAHTPHFAQDGGIWPVHCVQGTWGAEFLPGLVVAGPVVRKGVGGEDGYSGFSMRHPGSGEVGETGLGRLLANHAVTSVVVVGLATDYCVKETALDALALGLDVVVLAALTRPVERRPGDGERALEAVAAAGGRVVPEWQSPKG